MSERFDVWAVVELFGHQQIAGRVCEAEIGGGVFIRVDVPENDEQSAFTRYFGPSAIYSITPMSEDAVRLAASHIRRHPMTVWCPELQRPTHQQLPFYENPQEECDYGPA